MIQEAETLGRALAVGETSKLEPEAAAALAEKAKPIKEKRVLIKEQFDRLAGVKDDKIIERNDASMAGQKQTATVAKNAPSRSFVPAAPGVITESPISRQSNMEPIRTLNITPETFDPKNHDKRPSGWAAVRQRRLHRKEQLDRLRGVVEATIIERRAARQAEEEEAMIREVMEHGNVVGVGGLDPKELKKNAPEKAGLRRADGSMNANPGVSLEQLDISSDTFDPSDESKRPSGWAAIRKKRIYKREQLDRLRGVSEAIIQSRRAQREKEEEEAMVREVAQHGNVLGAGGVRRPQEEETPEELEMRFDPEDFDLATNKRPKGWALVKLRRVYIKEWKDRKDGLDEEEIMERRYQREQEAEQEMIQEMSVNGRIRAFERAIQRNKRSGGGGFTKGFQASLEKFKKGVIGGAAPATGSALPSGMSAGRAPRRASIKRGDDKGRRQSFKQGMLKSSELSKFMERANQTLESLADKVADNLSGASSQTRPPPVVSKSSAPRIIAPRAIPLSQQQRQQAKAAPAVTSEQPVSTGTSLNSSSSPLLRETSFNTSVPSARTISGKFIQETNVSPERRPLGGTREKPVIQSAIVFKANPLKNSSGSPPTKSYLHASGEDEV
jgi:hypothetical protein